MQEELVKSYPFYCPRCDRVFDSHVSFQESEELVKKHVANSHLDYDPNWFDTYPEAFGN